MVQSNFDPHPFGSSIAKLLAMGDPHDSEARWFPDLSGSAGPGLCRGGTSHGMNPSRLMGFSKDGPSPP